MAYPLSAWAQAFLLTELVEAPIYRGLLPCRWWQALLPSAITHPLLWYVLFPHSSGSYWTRALVGELIVVALEAFVATWFRARPARALMVSLVANAASTALGLLTHALFG